MPSITVLKKKEKKKLIKKKIVIKYLLGCFYMWENVMMCPLWCLLRICDAVSCRVPHHVRKHVTKCFSKCPSFVKKQKTKHRLTHSMCKKVSLYGVQETMPFRVYLYQPLDEGHGSGAYPGTSAYEKRIHPEWGDHLP